MADDRYVGPMTDQTATAAPPQVPSQERLWSMVRERTGITRDIFDAIYDAASEIAVMEFDTPNEPPMPYERLKVVLDKYIPTNAR